MPIRSQIGMPKFQFPNIANGNAAFAILGEGLQVALRYYSSHWQLNKWDGGDWNNLPVETHYDPEIPVKGIEVLNGSETSAVVEFDLVGYGNSDDQSWNNGVNYQIGVVNTLSTMVPWPKRITRIYLAGSNTTATEIYLSA